MRIAAVIVLAAVLAGLSTRAQAQPPLNANRSGFPGSLAGPASAASAGLGLADRWLADQPFDNPALAPVARLAVTPAMQRMSRQDLRADNRDFDEQLLFFDAAGAWIGGLKWGTMWTAYASQPVVRLEDHAYVRGLFASPEPPAIIEATTTVREMRAGLGASTALAGARVGLAVEWTRRDDQYDQVEQSGSPDAGETHVEFSGDGIGGVAGARIDRGDGGPWSWSAGAGVRFVPEITVEGSSTRTLVSGDFQSSFEATRESALEGGLSGRVVVTPTFQVTAGAGGRTGQDWEGFGVGAGPSFTWSVGGAFKAPEAYWSARFGLGQEQQRGVPEPRAGIVGIGFGWGDASWTLDLSVLRRSIERADRPTSFDDRLLATYSLHF
jgi:hypothetical protein